MTVAVTELAKHVNKRVVLHVKQDDGTLAEKEGKIEAASEAGLAFKEKGSSKLDLYLPEQIEEIQAAPEKPKSITQKKVKIIEVGQARQHLADRHGVPLSWLKANDEQTAFEYHESLDHADLGHRHEAPKVTDRDKALAEGDEDETGEDTSGGTA